MREETNYKKWVWSTPELFIAVIFGLIVGIVFGIEIGYERWHIELPLSYVRG